MKAILEFDLSDSNDAAAHFRCIKAINLYIALWEIAKAKKGLEWTLDSKDESFNKYEVLELVYDKIGEILEDNNINFNELE